MKTILLAALVLSATIAMAAPPPDPCPTCTGSNMDPTFAPPYRIHYATPDVYYTNGLPVDELIAHQAIDAYIASLLLPPQVMLLAYSGPTPRPTSTRAQTRTPVHSTRRYRVQLLQ
jgi:hypothetical protein